MVSQNERGQYNNASHNHAPIRDWNIQDGVQRDWQHERNGGKCANDCAGDNRPAKRTTDTQQARNRAYKHGCGENPDESCEQEAVLDVIHLKQRGECDQRGLSCHEQRTDSTSGECAAHERVSPRLSEREVDIRTRECADDCANQGSGEGTHPNLIAPYAFDIVLEEFDTAVD